jgi:hypothetical protein
MKQFFDHHLKSLRAPEWMTSGATRLRAITVLAALVLATGCASGGTRSTANGPLTSEDLVAGRFSDVSDALRRLRPGWMNRVRGVFIDGHSVAIETLDLEPISGIAEINLLAVRPGDDQVLGEMRGPLTVADQR